MATSTSARNDQPSTHEPTRRQQHYVTVCVAFVVFLVCSNIAATKLIEFDFGFFQPVFDGGAILFPLTYILGDVLAEVWGFKAARRAIIQGLVFSVIAALTFYIVAILPAGPGYENQEAFEAVLGFVPRIVLASTLGFLIGQLINSWVLVKMKEHFGDDNLWTRLLGSTLVGQFVDTLVFCTVAFYGVITGGEFLNYLVVGYVYKVAVEVLLMPVTYAVISYVRR